MVNRFFEFLSGKEQFPLNYKIMNGIPLGNDDTVRIITEIPIEKLPPNLHFRGEGVLGILDLYELNEIGDGLTADDDLFIYLCPELENLPENMVINGKLFLNNCLLITEIPESLIATEIVLGKAQYHVLDTYNGQIPIRISS